ncbi:MAG TPA: hypothetical protein V6C72_14760 [Chroococcales cyanobacterium]
MHDCPTCQVPLHGHEEVCPSCGTKQYVKPEYRQSNLPKPPGVNPWPFVIAVIVCGAIAVIAASNSWIGQMIMHGPPKSDPMDAMTKFDARKQIEAGLNSGLQAVGATAKMSYVYQGKPSDQLAPGPVELKVETELKDPNSHKAIVDPIKQYMEKAEVTTLTFNDTKSHATWTYNVSLPPPDTSGSGLPGADGSQPDAAQSGTGTDAGQSGTGTSEQQ